VDYFATKVKEEKGERGKKNNNTGRNPCQRGPLVPRGRFTALRGASQAGDAPLASHPLGAASTYLAHPPALSLRRRWLVSSKSALPGIGDGEKGEKKKKKASPDAGQPLVRR